LTSTSHSDLFLLATVAVSNAVVVVASAVCLCTRIEDDSDNVELDASTHDEVSCDVLGESFPSEPGSTASVSHTNAPNGPINYESSVHGLGATKQEVCAEAACQTVAQ
jgi:hypothetical protein